MILNSVTNHVNAYFNFWFFPRHRDGEVFECWVYQERKVLLPGAKYFTVKGKQVNLVRFKGNTDKIQNLQKLNHRLEYYFFYSSKNYYNKNIQN